jgi:hypothetical protein
MAEPSYSTSTTYGSPCDCYKSKMTKIVEKWLLYKYVDLSSRRCRGFSRQRNKRSRRVKSTLSVCAKRLGSV